MQEVHLPASSITGNFLNPISGTYRAFQKNCIFAHCFKVFFVSAYKPYWFDASITIHRLHSKLNCLLKNDPPFLLQIADMHIRQWNKVLGKYWIWGRSETKALMERRALMERCAHWAPCFWLISPKWLTFQAKDMHIREWNNKVFSKSAITKGGNFPSQSL